MVWGCFSAKGVGHLRRIEGIMRKEDYHNILSEHMIPSAESLFPDGNFIFQEDNDPKHTARMNRNFLHDQGVTRLDWPANSPDLNPIENLWSILSDRMCKCKTTNQEELFESLQQTWQRLGRDLLTRLAHSMKHRCRAVIKAKGGHTKY